MAQWAEKIVENDNTHQNHAVALVTMDPGKTLADIEDYQQMYPTANNPPPFTQIQMYIVDYPLSRIFKSLSLEGYRFILNV